MSERLSIRREEPNGIDRSKLRLWGLVIIALGVLSRGILQNRVLGVNGSSSQQLLEVLNMSGGMTAAAVALALQALESCAVPIFAVLLVDGFQRTGNLRNYLLRIAAVAVVSQLPYNFALYGSFLHSEGLNPVFGSLLSLIMLYLYDHYAGLSLKNICIKLLVTAAALLWAVLFRVEYGVSLLVIVAVLWTFWERPTLRYLLAAAAAMVCCVGNPLFMFAPFGFLLAHFYNGEEGKRNPIMAYGIYPLLLLLIGAAGWLLF